MTQHWKIITLLLLGFTCIKLQAQTNLICNPPLPSSEWSEVWQALIEHEASSPIQVYAEVRFTPRNGAIMQVGRTRLFSISNGKQLIQAQSHPLSGLVLNRNTALWREESQGGKICIYLYNTNQQLLANCCADFEPIGTLPPELVYPFDEETISIPTPVLTWTPPTPFPLSGLRYDLKLVEMRSGQSPGAAIMQNPAFFSEKGLHNNVLAYPLGTKSLTEGKTYAWQVKARSERGSNMGITEVWSFTYQPEKPEDSPESLLSGPYVILRPQRLHYGARYSPGETVGFQIPESYGIAPKWSVKTLEGETVSGGEAWQFQHGARGICYLSIPEGTGLETGGQYILNIRDAKNKPYYLRFTYHQNHNEKKE